MRLRSTAPVFLVPDIAATIRWYQANLGFVADPFPEQPPHSFCALIKDDCEIMLQQLAGYQPPDLYKRRAGGVWDAYVRTVGVRDLFQILSEVGEINILEPIHHQPYGQTEFVIKDPNGYVLVFGEAD